MELNYFSLKQTARLTGLLYILSAITAIFDYTYVSAKLSAEGNIVATADKMLANEVLFRTSLLTNIIGNILFVIVIIMLYRVLKQVNGTQALVMASIAFVAIPVSFIAESCRIAALYIFKGELLKSYPVEQAKAVAELLLNIGNYSAKLITFHWGFWLLPMGWLVYNSRFIPRILGIFLVVNGFGFIITSVTFILFPEYLGPVLRIIFPTFFLGEIPLMFWLAVKGIKIRSVQQSTLE